jgi:xanthine/CO dehydrogenase XdhC/CoxF family maturation factor
VTYDIIGDDAFAVGLTRGGIIEVLVQRIDLRADRLFRTLLDAIRGGEPVARAIVGGGAAELGSSVIVFPDAPTDRWVHEAWTTRVSGGTAFAASGSEVECPW